MNIHEISVDDYNALRKAVKWILVTPERAAKALNNSYYKIIAYDDGKPVGMARIVSDGGYTYFITDVIVLPEYQGKHIGTNLIDRILNYIEKDVKKGETVGMNIQAVRVMGLVRMDCRPFGNHGPGMSMWVSRIDDGSILPS